MKAMSVCLLFSLLGLIVAGCSGPAAGPAVGTPGERSFAKRFVISKGNGLRETLSGNSFVADLPGVHPLFGEAVTIRVRGLKADSVKDEDPRTAARAYDQWLKFKRTLENAKSIELRNLERGRGALWVWADLYLEGRFFE